MGKFVLIDARVFTGGADLSGASNKIELNTEREAKPAMNFRSGGWEELLGGLASSSLSGEGQWEAGDPGRVDDAAWAGLGGLGPWTMCPTDATQGALAYLTYAMTGSYKLGGQVGEVAPWTAEAKGSWPVARGAVAHPPGTARTADGNGAALQLGEVDDGRHLYAALHVLSVAGTGTPSITVEIESAPSAGFASPTTVAAFTAATGRGGQILRTAGPITDTHYRAVWTITGTAPSFLFLVALGIQ
ncbi:hypothetical protein [Saccharothrix lopnurensis]|uniref:Uncharacterized protein n=1 Tax=Saccharothrix lopnurensis TaxID=1670621 RepID=A0ABW1PGH1_9PSEU